MIEDQLDWYYLGLININPKRIIMRMNLNVTSKMYDLSKARNMSSTIKGSCRLKLLTPDNGDTDGSFNGLLFFAHLIAYMAILGGISVIILLVLKCLADRDTNNNNNNILARQSSESGLLLPDKSVYVSYKTNEEDEEEGSSISSSEDLYNAKLCAICYDDHRNCFFVPCGHCVTCYECARRIMEEDNKMCPICRRLVRKVRPLVSPQIES